jgi:hemerythrin-like domain-containing protein
MTKATEILSSEHRVIEQVLDCLERIAQGCQDEARLDKASAMQALDFFRNFADRCHHGKEETHLFPALEAKGFPRDGGPTGVMLHEHDQGRACIRSMAVAADGAAEGGADAIAAFVAAAQGYIALLRQHIEKEDHCLFSMADRAFTAADQQQLLVAFEIVEREHLGAGTHEKYLQVAQELAGRYGVAAIRQTSQGCGGCGHGGLPVQVMG